MLRERMGIKNILQAIALLPVAAAVHDTQIVHGYRPTFGMRDNVIEIKFIVGDIFVARLAHLPVSSDNLEHDISGDIAAMSSRLLGFCRGLGSEEHGTDVPEDSARNELEDLRNLIWVC